MYSFNKLDDSSVIKIISSEESKEARRREEQISENSKKNVKNAGINKVESFKADSRMINKGRQEFHRTNSFLGTTTSQKKNETYSNKPLENDSYVNLYDTSVSHYIDS